MYESKMHTNSSNGQTENDKENYRAFENQKLPLTPSSDNSDGSQSSNTTFSAIIEKGKASILAGKGDFDTRESESSGNISSSVVHPFSRSKRCAKEEDSDSQYSLVEEVESRNFSKPQTAFSESDEIYTENLATTSGGYDSLTRNTTTSAVSADSHGTTIQPGKTTETVNTCTENEIRTPPSEDTLPALKGKGSSSNLHCYPGTERTLTVSDGFETQYYLAPLPSAVQDGDQTENTNDWEKLLDTENYGDCIRETGKVRLNEKILTLVSNSSLSSWSHCSLQSHLSQLNCRKSVCKDLDEHPPSGSNNDDTISIDGKPMAFIELHHQFRPSSRESGPEEDAESCVIGKLSKDKARLGERTMCSINSIDRVLKIQQKYPDAFRAMRKICMRRFNNFGIDDLRTDSASREGRFFKVGDKKLKNDSITANGSIATERFNSSTTNTNQYFSADRVYDTTTSESKKSVIRTSESEDRNTADTCEKSSRTGTTGRSIKSLSLSVQGNTSTIRNISCSSVKAFSECISNSVSRQGDDDGVQINNKTQCPNSKSSQKGSLNKNFALSCFLRRICKRLSNH